MLVVDRVVLEALEQPREVRELEGRRAAGRQQDRDAVDEVVQVRHLREHVVAEHEVGVAALADEPLGELDAEELDERRHAALLGRDRDVRRRVDPEHRHALRQEVLEQIAVVRGELDDEALRAEAEPVADHLHVGARVLDPGSPSRPRSRRTPRRSPSGGTNDGSCASQQRVQTRTWSG